MSVDDSIFECEPEDRDELMEELTYQIALNDLEYADTYRATPEMDGIEKHVAKQSCCGSWEGKHTCKSGNTYFIGCNYGH